MLRETSILVSDIELEKLSIFARARRVRRQNCGILCFATKYDVLNGFSCIIQQIFSVLLGKLIVFRHFPRDMSVKMLKNWKIPVFELVSIILALLLLFFSIGEQKPHFSHEKTRKCLMFYEKLHYFSALTENF